MACSLNLGTFSPLFKSLSDVKALEIYFRYQWNPLAYNFITTAKKKPKLWLLVVLILSNHVVIRSLSSCLLVFSNPFVVLLLNMLIKLVTVFSFFPDVSGLKPVLKESLSFGLCISMRKLL